MFSITSKAYAIHHLTCGKLTFPGLHVFTAHRRYQCIVALQSHLLPPQVVVASSRTGYLPSNDLPLLSSHTCFMTMLPQHTGPSFPTASCTWQHLLCSCPPLACTPVQRLLPPPAASSLRSHTQRRQHPVTNSGCCQQICLHRLAFQ